jgi:hypothetical protein
MLLEAPPGARARGDPITDGGVSKRRRLACELVLGVDFDGVPDELADLGAKKRDIACCRFISSHPAPTTHLLFPSLDQFPRATTTQKKIRMIAQRETEILDKIPSPLLNPMQNSAQLIAKNHLRK